MNTNYLLIAVVLAFLSFLFLKGFVSNRNNNRLSNIITSILGLIFSLSVGYIIFYNVYSNYKEREFREDIRDDLSQFEIVSVKINDQFVCEKSKDLILNELMTLHEHKHHHTHPTNSFSFFFVRKKGNGLNLKLKRDSYIESEYWIYKDSTLVGSVNSNILHDAICKIETN